MKKIFVAVSFCLIITGCVAHQKCEPIEHGAGFFKGLWQGYISPITFVISLFSDTITVWETNNNGGWYTFGFLLGCGALHTSVTSRKSS